MSRALIPAGEEGQPELEAGLERLIDEIAADEGLTTTI